MNITTTGPMKKLLATTTLLLMTGTTLPAHAVYEAVRVTAEIVSCPGERGLTKHHRCQTFIQEFDCDNGIIQSGNLTYKPGTDSPLLNRVCGAFTIDD